jgi:RNA polymerase sigma factor (TIGR02999 family)
MNASGRSEELTRLLNDAGRGEPHAAAALLPLVYEQLRALARQRMSDERAAHTLQATALVHEAYLRLVGADAGAAPGWSGRGHFYRAAAEAMRRILIEHARARGRVKRGGGGGEGGGDNKGGGVRRVPLDALASLEAAAQCDADDVLALDAVFAELERQNPDAAAVVRLRFYAGLSVDETAAVLGVSGRTVNREWNYARAWLFRALSAGQP